MDKAILELYNKFGVDIEKLIPQVIKHGQISSGIALKISVTGAIIFTAIIIGLFFIRKKADSYSTLENVCDIGCILCGIILFIFIICVFCNAYAHYMWMHSPRIMAIRCILSSIGGN